MKDARKMELVFSTRTLKLLSVPLAVSAVLFGSPLVTTGVNSYIFFVVPLLLAAVFFYIIDCLGEFESAFASSEGGIYEYFKQAYNRYIGYITAVLVFAAGGFLLSYWLFNAISGITPWGDYINLGITAAFIVILHAFVYLNGRFVTCPSYVLAGLLIAFILYLIFISVINYQVTLPTMKFDLGIFHIVFYLLLTLALYALPLSFFISETKEAEEDISDIQKFRKLGFAGGVTLLVVVLMGVLQQVGYAGSILRTSLFYTSIGEKLSSVPILFKIAPLIGVILLALLWFFALSRLIHRVAVDELFLTSFRRLHERFYSPHRAIILQAFLIIAIAACNLWIPQLLFKLSAVVLVIVMGAVIPALFLMRRKLPDMERPYSLKHWKGPSILIGGALFIMGVYWIVREPSVMVLLGPIVAAMLVLFIPYILFELYFNERVLARAGNISARLDHWFGLRRLILSNTLVEQLIGKMGDLQGKTVLDYGCKNGRVTIPLIEKVGREGKVYATDKSAKALDFLRKKIDRKGFLSLGFKIHLLQDFPSCVNPAIASVDHIISCGTIAGVRNVDHVLKEMNTLMPVSGHIVVMGYNKLFGFFPNKWLASDEQIKDYFDRNGFGVSVERRWRLFFEYVIITGIKFKDAFYLDTWYTQKEDASND